MDSIGDLIYVFLMVGAVIYSVIKKNKKGAENTSETPPPARDFGDLFPDMRNWMDDEDEDVPEEKVVETKKPVEAVETPKSAPMVFTYDAPEIATPGRIMTAREVSPIMTNNVEDDEYLVDSDSFDIRQAVLYSEILKRPSW